MRHWLQVATRNWRVKRVRTAGAVLAIALGTGAVVWVTCSYESVRQSMLQWAGGYVGKSHINVQSSMGKYDVLPQRIVAKIERIAGVESVAPVLAQRLYSATEKRGASPPPGVRRPTMWDVDFEGIDLGREFEIRPDWIDRLVAGRMLTPDDHYATVLEQSIAEEQGVGVGDRLLVWRPDAVDTEEPVALEIVGIVRRERIARLQKGVALVRLSVLQEITHKSSLVNSIDVVLAKPTLASVQRVAAQIRNAIRGDAPMVHVRSAAARMERIRLAQDQQQVVLVLLSCMALLTALFIILSTLSMGMIERIAQLGLLRCVGMTGGQLAALVLGEVLPLGVLGIALGVPIGLALTWLSVWLVPEYVGTFVISWSGVALACGAGFATTVIAAALPAFASLRVSPLEATRPRARRTRMSTVLASTALAVALLGVQAWIMRYHVRRDPQFVHWSTAAIALLYVLYAAAAPLCVWLLSRLAVPLTAAVVGVRTRLLQDQVGHAVWRSAGICCGLMVGLSLIVGLIVFNESFRSGWQFPKQFPEAFIWSDQQVSGDVHSILATTPGVGQFTLANAPNVVVEERPLFMEQVLQSLTWFLGVDPDSFFDMVQLEFVEGDAATARELLKQGGYVIVATDFARTRNKGVEEVRDEQGRIVTSNTVRVWFNNRWTNFKVAGVIDSPALDIAASYFQVQSESYVAAVGSVIGSNADLKRLWNVDGTKLVLLNFDLPPEPPPADWPPPRDSPAARELSHMHYDEDLPVARRWQNYREMHVLNELRARLGVSAMYASASELKAEIDARITEMTYLLTAVPSVALLVAALGVANLMTANVASRQKQLATLRAVGATRGLVLRIVIGEALVLGFLGSGLGLGLGLHLAYNITEMTARMWGYSIPFAVPWAFVGLAVMLTVGLCIVAGVIPARHAARTNVIAALHVS
jgi:ABC-type antimicrobial peptide transport system permease subunit